MKINKDQLQNILQVFIESNEPYLNIKNMYELIDLDIENNEDAKMLSFYLGVLNDSNLIECLSSNIENLGISFSSQGIPNINVSTRFRLTNSGHQTFEAMNNNVIWEKIKPITKELGIKTISQIPSLFIKLVANNIVQ